MHIDQQDHAAQKTKEMGGRCQERGKTALWQHKADSPIQPHLRPPPPFPCSGDRALNLLVRDRWSMGPTVSTAGRRLQRHSGTWQGRITPRPIQPMRSGSSKCWSPSHRLRIDLHLLPTGNVQLRMTICEELFFVVVHNFTSDKNRSLKLTHMFSIHSYGIQFGHLCCIYKHMQS